MTAQGKELLLRRFRENDLDEVHELARTTIETSYTAVYPPAVIDFFQNFHRRETVLSDAAGGQTVVVFSGDALVATGTRAGEDIRRVFVLPDYQRRGIGRLMMAELEAKAIADSVERIVLSASLPALEFYLRLGYEVVSEVDYEVVPGQHLEYYEMAKELRR